MATGTVAALLTPPGTGAIAVVRIAGPGARKTIESLFEPAGEATAPSSRRQRLKQDRLHYGRFHIDDEVIDDVIVSPFTLEGMSVVDVSTHGGVRIVQRVLQALEEKGIPLVKCDSVPVWPAKHVIEREIVDALQRAKTGRAVRFLTLQRQLLTDEIGRISGLVHDNHVAAMAAVEALLSRYEAARRLIDGVSVALVGPANSGKSTLFNTLVGRAAAIVSDMPGTTRDWVTANVEIDGLSVRLYDSAGTRSDVGELERLAIQAGHLQSSEADLRVLVLDGSCAFSVGVEEEVRGCRRPRVVVMNKTDIQKSGWASNGGVPKGGQLGLLPVSARTGRGVDILGKRICEELDISSLEEGKAAVFTKRQKRAASAMLSDVMGQDAAAADRSAKALIFG